MDCLLVLMGNGYETLNFICSRCGYCLFIFVGYYGMNKTEVRLAMKKKSGYALASLEEKFWIPVITGALEYSNGRISTAAADLGMCKMRFIRKMKQYGIDKKDYVRPSK